MFAFEGGGGGLRPKRLSFVGNATIIKFGKCKCNYREILLSWCLAPRREEVRVWKLENGHWTNFRRGDLSNTELSEFFGPRRVPGRELSEFLSDYSIVCVCQSKLAEFFPELTEFAVKLSEAQWVLFSETGNSTLETVCRPFPKNKKNFGAESWESNLDARMLGPNSWLELFAPVFSSTRGPQKHSPPRKMSL